MTAQQRTTLLEAMTIISSVGAVFLTGAMAFGSDHAAIARYEKQIPELIESGRRLEIQVEVLREILPRIERKLDAIDMKLNNRQGNKNENSALLRS
ncbi:MAG: hypothetical protein WC371_05395 [Parachlamydiales bacterium]|jgi:hypothetical protein